MRIRLPAPEPSRFLARPLAAFAAGAALPFGFAPFSLYPLAIAAVAVLFWLWRGLTPRQAAGYGFLFGLGQFAVGVSWVYVAIHDFGFTAAPVAVLLTAVFVLALALYPALAGALVASLPAPGPGWRLLLLMPAVWTGVEWLRGWLFTGFPWLSLGYAPIDSPLAGLAPLFGVYALSGAAAFTAAAVAFAVGAPRPRAIAVLVAAAAVWGLGAAAGGLQWVQPTGAPVSVALVQGNLPQDTKWNPDQIQRGLQTYARLSLEQFGKVDLVVWPENAVTVFYHEIADDYFAPLAEEARLAGTDLLLGVPVLDPDGVGYFTGIMSLGSAQAFYLKRHLVPFGEYVPLEGVLRGLIGFFDLPMSSFRPGPPGQPPLAVAGRRAAVSICYEDAFGAEIAGRLGDADLLVNGSNNAWYGDSLAPHQHLQISRMRALETGRPMLRATTNGISALIDHRGALGTTSPQFETAVLTGSVQPTGGTTPFVRWGNVPLLALLSLLLAIAIAIGIGRRRGAHVASVNHDTL